MSYSTIRAAHLATIKAALGNTWQVEVGIRALDLDLYNGSQIALFVHDMTEFSSITEIGGSSQEGFINWSIYYRVRHAQGRESEADLTIHAAMEAVTAALAGDKLTSSGCGPCERTTEDNLSSDAEMITWRQGWRAFVYPAT